MRQASMRAVIAAGVLAVADLALPRRGWGVPLFLFTIAVLVNTWASVERRRPRQPLPITLFGVTAALGAVAVGIYTAAGRTGLAMPGASNVLILISLACWMTAAVLLVRARSRVLDRYLVLDLGIFVVAAVTATKQLLLDPLFESLPPTGLSPSLSMTMLLMELVTIVFVVRYATLPGRRPLSMWLLVASLGASGTGSVLANVMEPQLGLHLSLLTSAMLAMAGLAHRSMPELTEPSPEQEQTFGLLRTTALGVALLLSPITAWVVQQRTGRLNVAWFVMPTVIVTGLVLVRLQLLFQREREARAELDRSRGAFRALIHGIADVVLVVDAEGGIAYVSASARAALGHEPAGGLADLVLPEDAETVRSLAAVTWGSGGTGTVEVRIPVGDAVRSFEATFTDRVDDPNVTGVIVVLHDVTERNLLEARLRHQALHDSLTGLPNRALLAERLVADLEHGVEVGMLFVDLDDFKAVNDGLGHEAGDRLLVGVADRLREVVRGSDTVARLGGDEFAVLVHGGSAEDIAHRVLDVLAEPFDLAGHRVTVGASVGVATAAGSAPEDLLRNADVAMYRAKTEGKGTLAIFEQGMAEAAGERLLLQMELTQALERDELRLVYQPIFGLEDGRMTGVEALLRWEHPTRGRLAPDRFITVAEETGLIVPMGRWALREACRQAAAWPGELHLAVNLSARQLEHESIVDHVAEALAASGLAANRLVLEITETMLARDIDATEARLARVTALGVRIAIDDFGTGYSSLSTLSRFPVHVLKIDRSFIATMLANPEASALVHALVEMGRALHLEVVAEGIEDERQAAVLREQHCHSGQGFYFARPLEAEDFAALLLRAA